MASGHTLTQFYTQFNPGTVFFVFPFILMGGVLTRCFFRYFKIESCYSIIEKVDKIRVEQ